MPVPAPAETWQTLGSWAAMLLHHAWQKAPWEVFLEVRYAWYKIHFFRRKTGGAQNRRGGTDFLSPGDRSKYQRFSPQPTHPRTATVDRDHHRERSSKELLRIVQRIDSACTARLTFCMFWHRAPRKLELAQTTQSKAPRQMGTFCVGGKCPKLPSALHSHRLQKN